jgi:hypothetical protein
MMAMTRALFVRLRLRELRARDVLLLRPLALPHVGEPRLGLAQILLRLALRCGPRVYFAMMASNRPGSTAE